MIKFIWDSWRVIVAILFAIGIAYAMEWSLWKVLIVLGVGYGIYVLHEAKHTRIAKALTAVIIVALVGNWGWSFFEKNFPITNAILPFSGQARDTQFAEKMRGSGFSEVKAAFILSLEKEEGLLTAKIPQIVGGDTNELNKLTARVEELKKLRQTINATLAAPRPTPTANVNVLVAVSTFTVDEDEVVSTLSVPNNSTVYIEADKAFCILEKYGLNDNGSEKLSKLTVHPGKSSRHFPWGGTVRVVGLFDNTLIKLHL